jgi:hypothetical protein
MLVLATSWNLFGQAQSGTVVGTVSDQEGAVIPAVSVTLVHEGTQFTRVTQSNSSGQYTVYSFPTGRITVTAEHQGFQKLVRAGLDLTAADTLTVNLQLRVGNVQETVQVTGDAPLLQSQTATVSTLISNQQILEMPLNGRTFTQLLQLGTGASPGTPGMTTGLTSFGMRANTNVSVNGSTAHNNSFLVDGLYNRSLWVNGIVMVPTVDSIQEARVMASNYSAQYGNAAGAVTIVQSKSGTNQFHGGVYEFLRNDKLDANTFFNNRQGARKPTLRRNEFGGTFGGPIRKDRTFFFGDYQGIRIVQPSTNVITIPTEAHKNMVRTGDFSALGPTIFDPYSRVPGPNNTTVRAAFAGNRIPVQRLDPAAVRLMSLLPSPNAPGNTRNFVFNPRGRQRADQFDVRLDQHLGSADRLFFKYSYDNSRGVGAGSLPPAETTPFPVGQSLTGGGPTIQKNWSMTANYTKVIGATTVNELKIGAVRNFLEILNADHEFDVAANLGIPNINVTDTNRGIPAIQISGFQTIGNTNSFPEYLRSLSVQADDILTIVKGSHTLKFGGGYTRHHFNGHTSITPRGAYNFAGQFTRQVGTGGAATALADLALGVSTTIRRSIQFGFFGLRHYDASAFAEDAWRVNNRLTLTYGMRYELQAPPYEAYDRWSNMDVTTGQFLRAGINEGGHGRRLRDLDLNNFAPRLGIAYSLGSDQKTVIRTGVGFSYFEANNGGRMLHSNPPMNVIQGFTYDQNGEPGLRFSDGIPLPVQPDLANPTQLDGLYTAFDTSMKTNKSMQWSFGIQRELLRNLMLDVAYVGSRTLLMTNAAVGNQARPGPGPLNPRRPLYGLNPILQDIDYRTNYGSSKYHSMQVNVTKRYARGLSASLAWTWSQYLSNSRGANSTTRPQDSNCYSCEYGRVPEDRQHMVVINHVYELPFGRGRSFLTDGVMSHIVGNWNISGIWTMYTGEAFGPSLATSVSNALGAVSPAPVERPNRNRDGNLPVEERTIDRWFDVGAFATPAQFTFGNSGVGVLRGPGYFNVDTGIHRNFQIREGWRLSYRWEMFNALNRPNFNNPNASIGNAVAGQISGTRPARIMQMALKLNF